jgi:hypothetical protein
VLLTLCCVLLAAVAYYGRVAIITVALHQTDKVYLGWHAFDERGYGPLDAMIGPDAESIHWLALSQLDTLEDLTLCQLHVTAQHFHYVPAQIKRLECWQCTFDDDALLELRRFHQLQSLRISDCQLPPLDWKELRLNEDLKALFFVNSHGVPQDFAWLSSYHGLEHLSLSEPSLDDAMLATFAADTAVESLPLNQANITDAGIAYLQSWPRLRVLYLSHTKVTDACVPTLAKLQLEKLSIGSTGITAAGLAQLVTLPELRELNCDGAMIDDTVAELLNERTEKLELNVSGDSIPLRRLLTDWYGESPSDYEGPPIPMTRAKRPVTIRFR